MPTTSYNTINGRIRGQVTAGVRKDYLTDALGSVTATVNGAGAVENTYRHKPYGQLLAKTGAGADPRYLWTGDTGSRRTIKNRAEQYNQARHYSSTSGLWTSVDPLWPSQAPFAYPVDPISLLDPSGLCCKILKQKRFQLTQWCVKKPGDHGIIAPPKDTGFRNVRGDKGCAGCWKLRECPYGVTGEYTVTLDARQDSDGLTASPKYSATGCAKPAPPNPVGGALKKLIIGLIGEIPGGGSTIGAVIDIIDTWPPEPPRGRPTVPPKTNPCKSGYLPEFQMVMTLRYQCFQCESPPSPPIPPPPGTGFGDDYPGSCTHGRIR